MSAEYTPKPVKLLRGEQPNILYHAETDARNLTEQQKVLYQNDEALVTEPKDNLPTPFVSTSLLVDPYFATAELSNFLAERRTITVSDAKTGLPDYELTFRPGLRPCVKKVTIWDYTVFPDEDEEPGPPIVGIKKTEITPRLIGFLQRDELSELPMYPHKKELPQEELTDAISVKKKRYRTRNSSIKILVDDILERLGQVESLADLNKAKKYSNE